MRVVYFGLHCGHAENVPNNVIDRQWAACHERMQYR